MFELKSGRVCSNERNDDAANDHASKRNMASHSEARGTYVLRCSVGKTHLCNGYEKPEVSCPVTVKAHEQSRFAAAEPGPGQHKGCS